MIYEDTEELIRTIGRKAFIYRWDNESYRRRRQSLAYAHHTSIEEIQLLCGEGWREALAEEQEEGLPLLYIRELRDRLESYGEEDLVWLADMITEALETDADEQA
jgi:hypothetical protein